MGLFNLRFHLLITPGLFLCSSLSAWTQEAAISAAPPDTDAMSPVYLKVQIEKPLHLSSLKPGDVVEGRVERDAYSERGEEFASGSTARLAVDHVEKRKRENNGRWPWVVGMFTPHLQRFPVFTEARIVGPDDIVRTLSVSLVTSGRKTEIENKPRKKTNRGLPADGSSSSAAAKPLPSRNPEKGPELLLEAHPGKEAPAALPETISGATISGATSRTTDAVPEASVPAGTRCRILLLDGIRSSTSRPGDKVRAVLLEPAVVGRQVVLPAGSMFQGSVTGAVRPRWLSRAGSLALAFNSVALPGGHTLPMASSIVGVELDAASKMRLDEEGRMHGGPPGLKWILIDGGVAAGLAKVADDGTQWLIEALLSTATDASTAGTARVVSTCVSGVFLLTRHGRDVRLPKYTEMTVTLDRPVQTHRVPGSGEEPAPPPPTPHVLPSLPTVPPSK